VDADGGDFAFGSPNAGFSGDTVGFDAVFCANPDGYLFKIAQKTMRVKSAPLNVENWIDHQLPRSVIGYIPAAVGVHQVDAQVAQPFRRRQEMQVAARPADGNDRFMLGEYNSIRRTGENLR